MTLKLASVLIMSLLTIACSTDQKIVRNYCFLYNPVYGNELHDLPQNLRNDIARNNKKYERLCND